jgi:tagatose 6-phosphate kinase
MIVTITPNTAIDHTLFIPALIPRTTIRATHSMISVAGKATDTSWVLNELGYPTLAMGFAAGRLGQQMVDMMHRKGIPTDFTWVSGETRLNTVIMCEDGYAQTTITVDTLDVLEDKVTEFYAHYREVIKNANCVTISGSLPKGIPPDFYYNLVMDAHATKLPVVIDASGKNLQAGYSGNPTVIKPNLDELEQLWGESCVSIEQIKRAGRELYNRSGSVFVITLGAEGAVAILPDRNYFIPPLKVKVVSPAGAGDAVVAGLAAGLSQQKTYEDGLRLAFAAASAAVMMPGTADIRKEDVDLLLPQIELIPL